MSISIFTIFHVFQKYSTIIPIKPGIFYLSLLHVLNDGYYASFILLLPFIARDFHINLSEAGILGALPGILAIIVSLPSAPLAIRFGGVRILFCAALLYALSYLLLPVSFSFLTILPFFVLAGAAFGSFHPIAFAVVARLSDPKTRGSDMGKFTALGDTGKVAISALVTFLAASYGWKNTSVLYGMAALFFIFALFFVIKSKNAHIKLEKPTHLPIKTLLKNTRFLLASLTGILDYASSYPLFIFLPFLLLHKNISPSFLGTLVGAYLIGNLFGKTTLGKLTDKYGHAKVFIFAEACTVVCILLLTFSQGILPVIIISIILGTLTKGTVPVTQTMVTDTVEHHGNFEKSMSFYSFASNIVAALAAMLLGFISDHFGITNAFIINASFAAAAIIPAIFFLLGSKHSGRS